MMLTFLLSASSVPLWFIVETNQENEKFNNSACVIDVLKNVVGKRDNFYMVTRIQK